MIGRSHQVSDPTRRVAVSGSFSCRVIPRLVAALVLTALVSGCAILNPYYEDFDCRRGEGSGQCVDVPTAYATAKANEPLANLPAAPAGVDPAAWAAQAEASDGKKAYQEGLYQQMAALAKAPKTPLMIPPKVMRVLVLGYEGKDGELYMPNYFFVKVDDAKWVMSGGRIEPEE